MGMPVLECMRRHTHRQYRTILARKKEKWNEPSRSDYYVMQVAREVNCVLKKSSERSKVVLDMFKIPFRSKGEKPPPPKPMTEAQKKHASMIAKARWFSFLGIKPTKPES